MSEVLGAAAPPVAGTAGTSSATAAGLDLVPAARRPVEPDAVGVVAAVCRTWAVAPDHKGEPTGIDKRAVDAVVVGADGVLDDRVLDTRHHGGRDKAVYAYAAEDAEWWAERLGRDDVAAGWFGENLLLRGVDVSAARVGERWRLGRDVVVEVTQPRTPCATFQHRTGERGWQKRFLTAGRPGAYLRVHATGTVRAGDPVVVEHRPAHGVGLGRWVTLQDPADARALLAAGLEIAPSLLAHVRAAAGRG
ncbi:MOSC domain-containing protein [Aquipuribacter sp. SD81]|uniref:MOSC domain-containing protein n=1 Tax=Aquipuribacter sp. SD81 TaxID=3127703 RepID=UPI003015A9F2